MFGFHVAREWGDGAGIVSHVEKAYEFVDRRSRGPARFAFQIFISGPQNMKFTVDTAEAAVLRKYIESKNGLVWGVAHGTFLDNPWNTGKANHGWTVKFIKMELARAAEAGLAGVVVHLGTQEPGVVVGVLRELLSVPPKHAADFVKRGGEPSTAAGSGSPPAGRIYLEIPAVNPEKSRYASAHNLVELFALIRKEVGFDRVGLCIDTAHISACGVDISSYEHASDWIDVIEDGIPPGVVLLHLNDNRHPCGSGRDEHDSLLIGEVWGEYKECPEKSGMNAFLQYAVRFDIPTVLERSARKAGNRFSDNVLSLRCALESDLDHIRALL
jgi:deoxyribonuclease-4